MSGKKTGKKKQKRTLLIVLLSLSGVIIAGLVTVVALFFHFYNMTDYQKDPETVTVDPSMSLETIDISDVSYDVTTPVQTEPSTPELTDEPTPEITSVEPSGSEAPSETPASPTAPPATNPPQPTNPTKPTNPPTTVPHDTRPTAPTASSAANNEWPTHASEFQKYGCAAQIDPSPSVYNIILIGVDRPGASGSNADANILLSINHSKRTIYLTSIMRDSYCYIPGYGWTKMNSGFALWGYDKGGYLMASELNATFGFPINNYAWTTFADMIKIINTLGGLDMQLTPQEAAYIGITIPSTQVVHLDGAQVLKHARDRSSGGNDYMRTQRQREVVLAIVQKARSGGLGNLAAKANQVLPYIKHNIDAGTMATLMANLNAYSNYNFVQMRIPMDGTITGSVGGSLVMDVQRNSTAWKNTVY
ncbi:MAG: LCP family protein [Lachnospiraceae bacterium]|nr:LCP family protein [Lachnospiraceae bacterium]